MVGKTVHRNCTIMLPNRVTYVELEEFDMVDFDVILGMDWLNDSFAFIDFRKRIFKFDLSNEPILEWNRGN